MPTPAPFARSHAVVIGINAYGTGITPLRTATNDAARLAGILRDGHGYDVTTLLDADASLANLTTLLSTTLPATVKADDRVLFYFAGHGVARDDPQGPNGYLLPADARRGDEATYLHMPLVHDALVALPCRHMLVVLDSCFSGAFRWSGTRDAEVEEEVVYKEKYDRFVRSPAWQVITSAAQDQKALDQLSAGALGNRDGDGDHSPFAMALFDALAGKGDLVPAGTGDGLVTATELFLYIGETLQNAVEAAGKSQTPGLWPLRKHDKGEYVFFVPGRELLLQPAPPLTFESNPWVGLASYEAASASLFFGRDAEIATLRSRIETQPLTVVLGASGTGKSSLVKAGVLPRLTTDGWTVLPVVRPGTTPMVALAQAITGSTDARTSATSAEITSGIQRLIEAHPGQRIALVIDQFEELITLVRSAAEREQVLTLLAELAKTHADVLRLVLTIRTDFEPNFDRSAFGDRWRDGRYVVPPMSRENLKAVIEKPAAARVLYFDPSALVDTLLDEVVATPGALPLLSFALSEMYITYLKRQGGDRAITRADYEALGGVVGALRARAEAEYESLDQAHRDTLRRVMLRLVSGDGGGLARRRVMDAELLFGDAAEAARVAEVVRRLIEARLLVKGKEPDGEAFVEPAHDALVRGWGRLLQWVREENETKFPLSQQQRLARAADDWHRTDSRTSSGLLWSDSSRSAQLASLVRNKAPWLNRREMAFAQRSIRGRRITIATAAGAVLTIVVAGVAAIIGGRQASARAEQVRVSSIVNTARAMATEDPLVAGMLLGTLDSATVVGADDATQLTMLGVATTLRAQPHVVATFGSAGDEMSDAAISHDGTRVVTATSLDRAVRVWTTDGRGRPQTMPDVPGVPLVVAFSHDDRFVAAGGAEGWVTVWRLDGAVPVRRIPPREGVRILRLEFSPDDSRLLIIHDEARAELVDLDRPGDPYPAFDGEIEDVTFAANATELLISAGGVVSARMVPVPDGSGMQSRTLRTFAMPVDLTQMTVSPDRTRVALGSNRGHIRIYPLDGSSSTPVVIPTGNTFEVISLAWSADASRLVSTSEESTTTVWNARTGEKLGQFRRIEEPMETAAFSPDMDRIVTTSEFNFQALVWRMGRDLPDMLPGQTQRLVRAAFAGDSRHVLTASFDGSARFWELPAAPLYGPQSQPAALVDLARGGHEATASALSPDSRFVAIGNLRGDVWLFRTDSAGPGERLLAGERRPIIHLEFSPDNHRLHAITRNGARVTLGIAPRDSGVWLQPQDTLPDDRAVMRVKGGNGRVVSTFQSDAVANLVRLDVDAPRQVIPGTDPGAYCVTFDRRATRMARCTADSTVRIGPPDGRGPERIIRRRGAQPQSVALANTGDEVAIGFADGSVRLYGSAPADTGRLFAGHTLRVRELQFAPDDGRLLSNADDGTVRIWDLRGSRPSVIIRPRGALIEDAMFTPDGRRVLTRGLDEPDARLWNADGTGSFVSFSPGGIVKQSAITPDGQWLLTVTDKATATLFPLQPNRAMGPYRRITAACLTTADRVRYLLETRPVATRRNAECETGRRAALAR